MTQTQEVMESGANTAKIQSKRGQHLAAYKWQPGQSGNPKGKPQGSKHKLAEHFVAELQRDFLANGPEAIKEVRERRPADYLRIIASIVPKEFTFREEGSTRQASDDELFEKLNAIRNSLLEGAGRADPQGTEIPRAEEVTDLEPL